MRILLLLILFFFTANCYACPLLEQSKDISMSFEQIREIKGIKLPITSSGNFSIVVGKEVVWETLKPFYSKVVISKEGFKVQDQVYSAGALRQLSSILLQLHSGNLKSLEDKFNFSCKKEADQKFHLIALPKQEELTRVFKQVEIIGENSPEKINFIDARGDKTNVEFK